MFLVYLTLSIFLLSASFTVIVIADNVGEFGFNRWLQVKFYRLSKKFDAD